MFFLSGIVLVLAVFCARWLWVSKSAGIVAEKNDKRAKDMTEEEMHQVLESEFLLKNAEMRSAGFPVWYKNEAHVSFPYVRFTKEATLRSCKRCKEKFHIDAKGTPPVCRYHLKGKKKLDEKPMKVYICCDRESPCKQAIGHVPHETPSDELKNFIRSPRQNGLDSRSHKIFALDCEMVYTEHGLSLARLTVVDFKGKVVMNDIIRPRGEILDFNTEFSGISLQTFFSAKNVYTLEESRRRLFNLVNENSILIGHGLQNDFTALRLVHRRVVDTSILYPDPRNRDKTRQTRYPFVLSLKELSRNHLSKTIQKNSALGHCSEEDALAALELVMKKIDSRHS